MTQDHLLSRRNIAILLGVAAASGTIGALSSCSPDAGGSNGARSTSALDAILNRGTIRAGYSGFRPYTISNPNDPGQPSGFLIDVFSEIARQMQPQPKLEWSLVTFETLRADMDSGRIDVFADAVYESIPRAEHFTYTDPFGYFGVGVAVVRKDDNRFATLADLDKEGIVVSLAEGWTSTDFAKQYFKHAKLDIVPVGDDAFVPLNAVATGRADAALQDVPTVAQFVEANKDKVRALNLDSPPARVAAGFLLPQASTSFRDFLNVSLEVLRSDGSLSRIASHWKLYNEFPSRTFATTPGQ